MRSRRVLISYNYFSNPGCSKPWKVSGRKTLPHQKSQSRRFSFDLSLESGHAPCYYSVSSKTSHRDQLLGLRALVTGGSGDIGSCIASTLADHGASVTIASRTNPDNLANIASPGRRDPSISWRALDVTDSQQIQAIFASAEKEDHAGAAGKEQLKPGFDIVVNAAGVCKDSLLTQMDESDIQAMLNVNLLGSILIAKAATKHMIRQKKRGRLIFVGSIVGSQGNIGQVAYSAAKAGLVGLTRSLAKEVGSRNITVNMVEPGFIESTMTSHLSPEKILSATNRTPLKRLGIPEDVADAVLYLASPRSSYVTGQIIGVDGGLRL